MARKICLFVYENTNFLSLVGLLETFWVLKDVSKNIAESYDVRVCSRSGGAICGEYKVFIETESIEDHRETTWDTFVVCGGWGFDQAVKSRQIVRDVAEQSRKARRTCVIGGGAFVAAAAGLLDDCRVAVHPIVADRLAQQFPHLSIERNSLLDGKPELLTSPGMTSTVDLALMMIESDFGYRTAIEVAKYLVVPMKRSFHDPQLSLDLFLQERSDKFGPLHDWIRANLKSRLSIQELAERAMMSVRNFSRSYYAEMGISPHKAVEIIRIHSACKLLRGSKQRTKGIAASCGFGSERTFLRSFTKIIGMSPHDFRLGGVSRDGTVVEKGASESFGIELKELFAKAASEGRCQPSDRELID
jgi:transcriptional regulator GlxA family with amidase domain